MTKPKPCPPHATIEGEIWKVIARAGGLYEVSSHGRVRRSHKQRLLKPRVNRDGYLQVDLSFEARRSTAYVHALVCEAFHGERPAGLDAAHNDGVKVNNIAENLRWATRRENVADKAVHGVQTRGEQVRHSVLTASDVGLIRECYAAGSTLATLAKRFGVRHQTIEKIIKRQRWAHVP